MEIIEVSSIKKLLRGSKIIGIGTTAVCFLLKNGDVLKVFFDTHRKRELFYYRDIIEHLTYLSTLGNEHFIAPKTILTKENEVIAYIMPYRKAKTIKHFNKDIRLNEIKNSYEKLVQYTIPLCEKRLRLADLHDKNILFSDDFYVIDLDNGLYEEYYSIDDLIKYNCSDLAATILKALFAVKFDYDMFFNNRDVDDVYHRIVCGEFEQFEELTKAIEEDARITNPTIKDLQNNRTLPLSTERRPFKGF